MQRGPKTFGFPEGVNRAVSLIYADIFSAPFPHPPFEEVKGSGSRRGITARNG